MSNQIYVGNLPFDLPEEDLRDLFSDYAGVELVHNVRQSPKHFAFFAVPDLNDIPIIIREKNNTMIMGRNIVIRKGVPKSERRVQDSARTSDDGPPAGDNFSKEGIHWKRNIVMNAESEEYHDGGASSSSHCSRSASQCCGEESYGDRTCLSVVNFPFGTNEDELYELFSDFDPIDVVMISTLCVPTQAVIQLRTPEDATNAIVAMDNTIFNRRTLIVTDGDPTLVDSLLQLNKN